MNLFDHVQTGAEKPRSYDGDYMAIGKEGERIIIEWLKTNPEVMGIEDFRDIREVHDSDIDIGIRLWRGNICLSELKTDTWLGTKGQNGRQNVLNELLRINHHCQHQFAGYLGWTLRSPAQFLFMYAPNRLPKPAIYRAEFSRMRAVLQRLACAGTLPKLQEIRTDIGKTTYVVLVPEEEYNDVFKIYEL